MTRQDHKKKSPRPAPRLPDVRSEPARPLVTGRGAPPSYPGAVDLIARSPEWRSWLEAALRQVLGPAAIAGAVGLAGLGCDGGTAAGIAGQWAADGPPAAATGGPVAFTSGIAPDKFPVGGGLAPGYGPQGGSGGVVMGPLPPPLLPPLPPGPGVITPPANPPELDGDVAMVHPTPALPPPPIAPHPPALAGEAPAVAPLPPVRPPAMRGRIAPVRPIRPVAPPPDDPPIPGGLRPVMPDAD